MLSAYFRLFQYMQKKYLFYKYHVESTLSLANSFIAGSFLTVLDHRTGKTYDIQIEHNAVQAIAFKQIKDAPNAAYPADGNEYGLRVLDNGLTNTAVIKSSITYVDGHKGTIQFRGHHIQEIIEDFSYLDTAYLLIFGRVPLREESIKFQNSIKSMPMLPHNVADIIHCFEPDASPVMMVGAGLHAAIAAVPKTVPGTMGQNLYLNNLPRVDANLPRCIFTYTVVVALAYCHATHTTFTPPNPTLSWPENFLVMIGKVDASTGRPDPLHIDALEKMWQLVADHELTNSTNQLLNTASSLTDPLSCLAAGLLSAFGILHAGAIEVAFTQINRVGDVSNVASLVERVKRKEERLFGYGHRVYKTTDPRSIIIRDILKKLLDHSPQKDPALEVALEIDRIANEDEYFTSRNLKCNADLFASFVYKAMGIHPKFHVLFSSIGRVAGGLAHYREAMSEKYPRIWHPMQVYVGDL